jgi:DNA replication protein DnaC
VRRGGRFDCRCGIRNWTGKTWLARAIAQKACRDGYSALFLKAAELFRDLAASRADGSHSKHLYQLGHVDVLIVDDWAMAPLT